MAGAQKHQKDAPPGPDRRELEHQDPFAQLKDALGGRNYQKAESILTSLDPTLRALPEISLALALVQFELGKENFAFATLDDLSRRDLTFVKEVRDLRDRIAASTKDTRVAQIQFEDRSDLEALVTRARVEFSAENSKEALRLVEEALKKHAKVRGTKNEALLAEAHLLRAKIREQGGSEKAALLDYREVTLRFPLAKGADDALAKIEKAPLGIQLRLADYETRAEYFSSRGLTARVEDEMKRARENLARKSLPVSFEIALAFARYNSRREQKLAAESFAKLAARGDARSGEYRYYEGRAYARAYQHDLALAAFDRASKKPGPFAERGLYQAARLAAIDGKPAEAAERYRRYLARYGSKAASGKDATFGAALAALALGAHGSALKHLESLAKDTRDLRGQAQLQELIGLAHSGKGDPAAAAQAFGDAIAKEPFSLAALFARARLTNLTLEIPENVPKGAPPARSDQTFSFELPEKAARLHRLGLDTWAEDELKESEREVRQTYGIRTNEALCAMYGTLETAERRYQIAQTASKSEVLHRAPSPDEAWQWQCAFPRPYQTQVEAVAQEYKISPALIWAIMRQESAFRPGVGSPAGAIGLMQLMPDTARQIAKHLGRPDHTEALRIPAENIRYGAFYLSHLLQHFEGNFAFAIAAYNAGPNAVKSWLTTKKAVPLDLFVAQIPYEETRNYVYRVVGNFVRYTYLETGDPRALELPLEISLDASSLSSTF